MMVVLNVMLQNMVNIWDIEAVYFDCALYIFTAVLAVMTFYQLRSAFMVTSYVIFPAIFRVIFWKLHRSAPNSNFLAGFLFTVETNAFWIITLTDMWRDAVSHKCIIYAKCLV